jgi:hypothetical protein
MTMTTMMIIVRIVNRIVMIVMMMTLKLQYRCIEMLHCIAEVMERLI